MWTPSHYLKEAIASRNYIRIHNELCSVIHKDPTFRTTEFADTLRYVERQNLPDVIQGHDGRTFADRGDWTQDYWALVLSELMDNFSRDRLEHIRAVGRHLHGVPSSAPAPSGYGSASAGPSLSKPTAPRASVPRSQPFRVSASARRGYRSGGDSPKKLGAIVMGAGALLILAMVIGWKNLLWTAGAAVLIGAGIYLLRKR